jgi:hypothetical protein
MNEDFLWKSRHPAPWTGKLDGQPIPATDWILNLNRFDPVLFDQTAPKSLIQTSPNMA